MEYPSILWKEGNLESNLNELVTYAISNAEQSKMYYKTHSAHKRWWAKCLRVTAIIAAAFGGLLPIQSPQSLLQGTLRYSLSYSLTDAPPIHNALLYALPARC